MAEPVRSSRQPDAEETAQLREGLDQINTPRWREERAQRVDVRGSASGVECPRG